MEQVLFAFGHLVLTVGRLTTIQILLFLAAAGVWLNLPVTAFAQVLRHTVASTDSGDAWQSQRQCYKIISGPNNLFCAPVSTLKVSTGMIAFEGAINSNEEAYTVVSRLSDKDVDRPFLESLFGEDSFQTVSGNLRFSAIYGETTFALVPFHLAAAYKISNPSLPEVNLAAVQSSHLMVTHNLIGAGAGPWNLLAAPVFVVGTKEAKTGDFDVLELGARGTDQVIATESWTEKAGGLALGMLSRKPLVPSVSVRVNNISTGETCRKCKESKIFIADELETYTTATVGAFQNLQFGKIWVGLAGKFRGERQIPDRYASNALIAYRLGYLDSFLSVAPAIYSFGFMFDTALYRVGIQYTDEKQDNDLQISRRKHSYVHLGFKI